MFNPASRIFASTPMPSRPGITRSEHHGVDRFCVRRDKQGDGRVTAIDDESFVAASLHHVFHQPALHRVVIGDQNGGSHGTPARYNYLSRIGALSPMAINVLLRGVIPKSFFRYDDPKSQTGSNPMASPISAPAKSSAQRKSAVKKSPATKASAGKLPEWNLADLYSGIDAPEVVRDLDRMDAECIAFEQDYKGKLAEGTAKDDGGVWLAAAVETLRDDRRYRRTVSAPMPGWFMPATPSIPRSPNSTAMSPSA